MRVKKWQDFVLNAECHEAQPSRYSQTNTPDDNPFIPAQNKNRPALSFSFLFPPS